VEQRRLFEWHPYDLGDWVPLQGMAPGPGGADSFGSGGALSLCDIMLLNVIGWNLSVPSNEIPSGVTDYVSNYVPPSVQNDPVPAATSPGQNMTVLNGGVMMVGPGGAADGTIIDLGGWQIIDHSVGGGGGTPAVATNTTIAYGGEQDVHDEADNTDISGLQLVYKNGEAKTATVENGGLQSVSVSGGALNTTIHSGGEQLVMVLLGAPRSMAATRTYTALPITRPS
jgi:autotransporter passenger strand-loop-strand repeat protein